MRIVNREEFLKQPFGTIFAKYSTMSAPGLGILENVWDSEKGPKYMDFIYQPLEDVSIVDCTGSGDMYDKCVAAEADSTLSLPTTFDDTMRDALFDEDQLFLIWEKQDVEKLVAKLQHSLNTAYRPK